MRAEMSPFGPYLTSLFAEGRFKEIEFALVINDNAPARGGNIWPKRSRSAVKADLLASQWHMLLIFGNRGVFPCKIKPAQRSTGECPWNKGKLTGAKPPRRPKHVWSIRTKLQIEGRSRPCHVQSGYRK